MRLDGACVLSGACVGSARFTRVSVTVLLNNA